jgi:GAF domain-containing protein
MTRNPFGRARNDTTGDSAWKYLPSGHAEAEIRKTADFVGVGLPDPDNHIHALDFVVDGDFPDGEFVPEQDILPVRVFHTGSTRDLPDRQSGETSFFHAHFKTVCVLPLLARDGPCGILVLGRRDDKPYAQDDMDFLGQVSNQIWHHAGKRLRL